MGGRLSRILFFFAPRRIFSSILALIFPRLLLNFNFLVAFNYSRPYLILPLPLICSLLFSASFASFILRCQPSSSIILISFNSKTILSLKIHLLSPFLDYFICFLSSSSLPALSFMHFQFYFESVAMFLSVGFVTVTCPRHFYAFFPLHSHSGSGYFGNYSTE
jgi:hypothetical protein